MKHYNEQLSKAFHEIADLMGILGENTFKVRAYRNAAIRLKETLEPITKKNAIKNELKKIPKIGEAIADKIVQHVHEGKIDYLEKLRRDIPKSVRDLLNIPGLGPSRVRDLFINLQITSKKELLKAAKAGKIAELPGFGEKLVKQILDTIKSGQKRKKRHKRAEIESLVQKAVDDLSKIKTLKKVTTAGSYRRESPEVGDVDILCTSKIGAQKLAPQIEKCFPNAKVLARGDTKMAFVIFPENLQIDIRFVPPESYGAALLYFTGSKNYNITMRKEAINQGYLLNEYGLFKDGEYVAGKTEKEVYKKLKLNYREPKNRK